MSYQLGGNYHKAWLEVDHNTWSILRISVMISSLPRQCAIFRTVIDSSFPSDVPWRSLDSDVCKKSAIVFNATLANGNLSGKFLDHGDLGIMEVCQDLCCQSMTCDVAFMSGRRCFSVHCHSSEQCQWTPAKNNKNTLQLSYVTGVHDLANSSKYIRKHVIM